MHAIEVAILDEFRRNPSEVFSTTEMVREIFKQPYAELHRQIHSEDRKTVRKGYAQKARLHRKLLYHVNRLVESGLLAEAGMRGKGEKLFALAIEEGELVVQGAKRKIVISKSATVATPLDGYEKDGYLRKFEPGNWLSKHNAVLIDCAAHGTANELQERLRTVFPAVNDAIALHRFEHVIEAGPEQAEAFLRTLGLDAHDYDVSVTVLVNLLLLQDEEGLIRILRRTLGELPKQVGFVFTATSRQLTKREALLKELIETFSDAKQKLTLKNDAIFAPPLFFGRAGAYSFTEDDWAYYKGRIRAAADGCVVGQVSIVVDLSRYFSGGGATAGFREMLDRAARALFEVEEQRRRHFGDRFGQLAVPGIEGAKEFFRAGRIYIRFWNYDWAETEQYHLLELLASVKEDIARFCDVQETIFKSCGLPIRFRIGLSTSFAKFDQDLFSERRYRKTAIASVKDLQTKQMKQYLNTRERLCKVFDGADRLRFFLARGIAVEETLRIARYLLSAHDLPSFTLDFRGKRGELKLTSFLEDA